MMTRTVAFVPCFLVAVALASADDSYEIKDLNKTPPGLSPTIAERLNPDGYQISGPDGPVCELWFVKKLPVLSGFKATTKVTYALKPGQLVGAMRVPEDSGFTDFRGQEIQPGTHTIRYAQQPSDENHFSKLRDFLVALPPFLDRDPATIEDLKSLMKKSAQSAEGEHPAILSLLPVEQRAEKPTLTHDDKRGFWILNVAVDADQDGKNTTIPFRVVVVGMNEE